MKWIERHILAANGWLWWVGMLAALAGLMFLMVLGGVQHKLYLFIPAIVLIATWAVVVGLNTKE